MWELQIPAKASSALVIRARGPWLRLGSSGPGARVPGSHRGVGAGSFPQHFDVLELAVHRHWPPVGDPAAPDCYRAEWKGRGLDRRKLVLPLPCRLTA